MGRQAHLLSRWQVVGAAVFVLTVAVVAWMGHAAKPSNIQLSYWYWHSPFELDDKLAGDLREMGVRQLFVRAGTWSTDGKNIVLVAPQSYGQGVGAFPVHLVFNGDSGVVRHFEDLDNKRTARQVADRIVARVALAQKAGCQVVGVQLDIDCPTRLLPKYAEFVRLVRAADPLLARPKGLQFSATGLASWLASRDIEALARQLDFLVPQAYEGETGMTVDEVQPVYDPATLRWCLARAASLPCPYWIGVPAYGHAFLFDDKGKMQGTFRDFEAQDALRHPLFKLERAYTVGRGGVRALSAADSVGEEFARFVAVRPAPDGRGMGYRLVYTLPSIDQLSQAYNMVAQEHGGGCQGAIVYRVPAAGSSFTVPMETQLAWRRRERPQFSVTATVRSRADELEAVDSGEPGAPLDLWIDVTAGGTSATFVAPDALVLDLTVDKPGFGDVRLRDFDGAEFLLDGETTSPSRADTVRFSKGWMFPGQSLKIGPIRLLSRGPLKAKLAWKARLPFGLQTTSGTQPVALIDGGSQARQ